MRFFGGKKGAMHLALKSVKIVRQVRLLCPWARH